MKFSFINALVAVAIVAPASALAAACDSQRGAHLFASKCELCHTATPGEPHTVGPNLAGVLGRAVGTAAGFGYTPGLTAARVTWTPALLDTFLTAPAAMFPDSAMAFAGLSDAADRAALTCFLAERSAATPAGTSAPAKTESAPEAAIRQRLRQIEALWAPASADRMVDELYDRDAIIAGEGMEKAARGDPEVRALVAGMVKDSSAAKLDLRDFRLLGPAAAQTWVVWTVTPVGGQQPFVVRSLMTWIKGKGGWRIVADMYSMGDM